MNQRISFDELKNADLIIDAIYESNGATNSSGDVLCKLMSVGSLSGFRKVGVRKQKRIAYYVLESTNRHLDWIDYVDLENGIVQYYGDNREPGKELHDTPQGGNNALKEVFEKLQRGNRSEIPPFFYFINEEKTEGNSPNGIKENKNGRNRCFIGLLVPGSDNIKHEDYLTAIWRTKNKKRYQNYKAVFTILDISKIDRRWINDLLNGDGITSKYAPQEWINWITKGKYTPLCAKDSVYIHRKKNEQMPNKEADRDKLQLIHDYFIDPKYFEFCAMKIVQLMDRNIHDLEHTRFTKDGGKDAVGKYRIGNYCDGIDVDFALEAKCYSITNSCGVKEISRIISRLKHREFGIFVTTSYVDEQAYQEVRSDGHPLIIISGGDILNILYEAGIKTKAELEKWLVSNFERQ